MLRLLARIYHWLVRSKADHWERILQPTKRVKIQGIIFVIRKINPIDYLAGFRSVQQFYDVYRTVDPAKAAEIINPSKIKQHYRDVILSGVVEPKLTLKAEEAGLWVDRLYDNWQLCEELYTAIIEFTYGKKKFRLLASPKSA